MTTRTDHRHVRRIAALALTIAALIGASPAVSAGGWASATLDSTPEAEAGATTDVSFTILQHGVTPVDLDEGVGVEIVDGLGNSEFFPAAGSGTVGQYTATVTFPDTAGSYDWQIHMGWFGVHELGAIDVLASHGGNRSIWATGRWVVVGGALVALGVAAVGIGQRRRHRVAVV